MNTNPARGMRDFLPADVRKREYVIKIIKEVYESYGFEPLETPSVENLETLTGKYGEEGNQLIFKILKRGEKLLEQLSKFSEFGELSESKDSENSPNSPNSENSLNSLADLALRYDLTVPLARVVANYKNDLPRFFKRYQIQPVWRADRPARGRYREFYQCDVDAIGSSSMMVEAELISAVCEILERLGFDDFEIRINHREILFALLRKFGIPEEKYVDALTALDKIDKIDREGVEKELKSRGISDEANKKLLNAMEFFIKDNSSSLLSGKEKLKILNVLKLDLEIESRTKNAIENMTTVFVGDFDKEDIQFSDIPKNMSFNSTAFIKLWELLAKDENGFNASKLLWEIWTLTMNVGLNSIIKLDPTLARGLTYYTGAIFEIVLTDGDFAGSIGGGGRYDGLIGMFGKEQIPACGFSLGLERILVVMEERGMFPPELQAASADVLVTVWNEETAGESLKLANDLRQTGLRVLVYPEADKLGKQFKYAGQINVPFVSVLGESELAENKVALKNMLTGEQETLAREEIAEKIKLSLKATNNIA